jgi:hypothetical protein
MPCKCKWKGFSMNYKMMGDSIEVLLVDKNDVKSLLYSKDLLSPFFSFLFLSKS